MLFLIKFTQQTVKKEGNYMEEVILRAKDGYKLCLHIFEAEDKDNVKGYVQIIHGMEEHQGRYEGFARILNKAGYTVISSDMRGHGKNAPLPGFFKEKEGYKYLLSDQKRITRYIRKRFKTGRVIIFAHSMGTIIARNLMQSQSWDYEKVVLSGYPCSPGRPVLNFGIMLTCIISKIKGAKYYSKFIEDISVGSFSKKLNIPEADVNSWISRNKENVDAYIKDPYCGHGFKVSAFNDLFHLVKNMSDIWRYKNVNKELPVLAIRGEEDVSTGLAKGSRASIKVLRKAGFKNTRQIVYRKMRHEILNETGKKIVYRDIIKFLG